MTENVQLEQAGGTPVATVHRPDFHVFASALSAKYEALTKNNRVFKTEIDRGVNDKGALFDAFLDSFTDAATRQFYNCECCRRFLSKFGGLVIIDPVTNETRSALWNLTEDESAELAASDSSVFLPAMNAMRLVVEKAKIKSVFLSKFEILGEPTRGGWKHFFVKQGTVYDKLIPTAGQAMLESREDRRILAEFMGPIDVELLKKITTYFKNDGQLKNVTDKIRVFEWAVEFKETWGAIKNRTLADNYLWAAVATKSKGYLRVGGGVTGDFIDTIKGGGSYETAKANFLSQTDMSKYMKTTSAPKAGNVRQAESVFAEVPGLTEALPRRFVMLEDVVTTVWTAPVKEEAPAAPKSVFGHLQTKEQEVKPKTPDLPVINGGAITSARFMTEVLPNAAQLFMNIQHRPYDFMGLITAVNPEAHPLILWDEPENRNTVSGYSYHNGSMADYWQLPRGLVEVTHILPMAGAWKKSVEAIAAESEDLVLVLKGGRDDNIRQIPLSDALIRRDLHSIRHTLQRYFDSTPLTPLAEGQKPVVGLAWPMKAKSVLLNVHLRVINKDGATVDYLVERNN